MYAPLISRLNDLLLTTDRKQRLRITRSLMAANVFIACCFLQIYAWWVGYMEAEDVKRLCSVILVNIVVWYLVLRTGLNMRFEDPAMTLPQILSALTIIVGAFSVTGPVHGSTMMLLALVLVFGIFNMKQKGAIVAGSYTVVLMGIAILIKIRTDPVNYPFKLEIAHFVLTAAIVPTISGLAAQLSSLRSKLQAQKDELANALVRIQVLATRDELTGLFNRRHMIEVLGQHRKRLERSGHHRFCLALLDIDHFKRINDTYGHAVGDEVLRNFSKVVQSGLRDTDVLARWGGEEFLVLLNDTSPELANVGLERARMLLADATLVPSLPDLKPTFSAGLTAYNMAEALDICIERADRALYKAKDGGRNCTVIRMSAISGEVTDKTASPSSQESGALQK
ncbi:MAG: GGDEF domain-containing protein [Aquabacterium sp.]|uniref:GGDEF domain-containing protein n=1 Tax=Aquabacterium sp. TaxID=1872578 RepID=UPI0012209801|nr:GGDEF domain-containing protein [Aquabacterium sp.]TAK96601.1 MAG: GGDEF domain-containing protein [Aquabacterium sp.]